MQLSISFQKKYNIIFLHNKNKNKLNQYKTSNLSLTYSKITRQQASINGVKFLSSKEHEIYNKTEKSLVANIQEKEFVQEALKSDSRSNQIESKYET